MVWARNNATAYINLDNVVVLGLNEESGTWYIDVYVGGSTDDFLLTRLNGSWGSSADAMEAIRELVGGQDPTTYGD